MKAHAAVEVPARLRRLDRDHRGYPVPVIVIRDRSGRPNFAINDAELIGRLVAEDRCTICGDRLLRGRWLVGGCLSAFAANGSFADTAMHDECAHYALRACPYLAAPSYADRDKEKLLQRAGIAFAFDIEKTDPARPMAFVALMSVGVDVNHAGLGAWLSRPRRGTIRAVEVWKEGRQLDGAELEKFRQHARGQLQRFGELCRPDLTGWLG